MSESLPSWMDWFLPKCSEKVRAVVFVVLTWIIVAFMLWILIL